jgi:hypothetical protein
MHPFFALPVVRADRWQMQHGERFALDGLLAQLRPRLAIEIGTFEGGSLRRIAAYAEDVHAFDVDPKVAELAAEFDNVTFHIGDSAQLLPRVLADLERNGRHVDFALALLDCVPGYLVRAHADPELVGQAFNGLALVVFDAERDPQARAYDAPEFVSVTELHEAYVTTRERRPGQATAVGSAAAVSALLGAAAGALLARRRR